MGDIMNMAASKFLHVTVAFVVIAMTMIYLYLFTSVLLSTNLDDNRDLCRTTYDVLASFWIAGKVTVYLWFQEKVGPWSFGRRRV